MAQNELLEVNDPSIATQALKDYTAIFNEDPEYIMSHAVSLRQQDGPGGMTLDYFRQMLVTEDFEFVKMTAAINEPAIDELMVSVFEEVDAGYPGFIDAIFEASPDASLIFSRYYPLDIEMPDVPATMSAPVMDTAPEAPASIGAPPTRIAAPAALSDPAPADAAPIIQAPTSSPLPQADILEGPIRPRITVEPTATFDSTLSAVRDIQSQLNTLPLDPAERQSALNAISDSLEEIAIALTPSIAGDSRLTELPIRPSSADFDTELGKLNDRISSVFIQSDHTELSEILIQSSQQAAIVAREAGIMIAPVILTAPAREEVPTTDNADISHEPGADHLVAVPEAATPPAAPVVADQEADALTAPPVVSGPEIQMQTAPPTMTAPDIIEQPAAPDAADIQIHAQTPPSALVEPVAETQAAPSDMAEPAQSAPAVTPEITGTKTRLSELLDGHGYHNDTDGYTDYNAMQDAFTRASELGITDSHIQEIEEALVAENMILTTAAAIEGLKAYNSTLETSSESDALKAFFNAVAPEDFVQDLENSIDDHSVFDKGERDAVRDETIRLELPKPPGMG